MVEAFLGLLGFLVFGLLWLAHQDWFDLLPRQVTRRISAADRASRRRWPAEGQVMGRPRAPVQGVAAPRPGEQRGMSPSAPPKPVEPPPSAPTGDGGQSKAD